MKKMVLLVLLLLAFPLSVCAEESDGLPEVETTIITQNDKEYLNIDDSLCLYFENTDEASRYVRSQMKLHTTHIRIVYGTSSGNTDDLWEEIMEKVYEGEEGAYLRMSVEESETRLVDTDAVIRTDSGVKKIFYYEYDPEYYSSAEQEEQLSAAVSSIISSLALTGKSDYEKARAIYDYMCKNIEYDWDYDRVSFSPYGAAVMKKALCQGYAMLFYLLGTEAGLETHIIQGTADNGNGWIEHAWNIVKIDSVNYCLDPTWDAMEEDGYCYFLRGSEYFKEEHKYDTSYEISISDHPDANPPVNEEEDPEESTTESTTETSVKKIKISGLSHKIAAGKKIKLTANLEPKNTGNKKVSWTSSNKKIATVDSKGNVKIKKKTGGKTVIITAKAANGIKGTWKIKSMKGSVKQITVKGYKKTLKAGKTMNLKAKIKVTKGKPVNKKLKWTTSNKKYATVTQGGKVKAMKAGKGKIVKITALSTDGSNKKVVKKIKIK